MAEAFGRALASFGESLTGLAIMRGQKEMEEARLAREENLIRLRDTLESKQMEKRFTFEASEGGKARQAAVELEGARHKSSLEERRYSEGEASKRHASEITLRTEEGKREWWQAAERGYRQQVNVIDERLLQLRDEIRDIQTKATQDSGGIAPDAATMAQLIGPYQQEIADLQMQKRGVNRRMAVDLGDMGHPGYRPATEQEVAQALAERGVRGGPKRGGAPMAGSRRQPIGTDEELPPPAAQRAGGTSIKIPAPPGEPPIMKSRGDRKVVRGGKSPAAEGRSKAEGRRVGGGPEAFVGARQLIEGVRSMNAGIDRGGAAYNVASKIKTVLSKGGEIPPDVVVAAAEYSDQELRAAGLSETQLQILRGK